MSPARVQSSKAVRARTKAFDVTRSMTQNIKGIPPKKLQALLIKFASVNVERLNITAYKKMRNKSLCGVGSESFKYAGSGLFTVSSLSCQEASALSLFGDCWRARAECSCSIFPCGCVYFRPRQGDSRSQQHLRSSETGEWREKRDGDVVTSSNVMLAKAREFTASALRPWSMWLCGQRLMLNVFGVRRKHEICNAERRDKRKCPCVQCICYWNCTATGTSQHLSELNPIVQENTHHKGKWTCRSHIWRLLSHRRTKKWKLGARLEKTCFTFLASSKGEVSEF